VMELVPLLIQGGRFVRKDKTGVVATETRLGRELHDDRKFR